MDLLVMMAVMAFPVASLFGVAVLLHYRKQERRKRRRSPLSSDLLRAPGLTLQRQIADLQSNFMATALMIVLIPCLAAIAVLVTTVMRSGIYPSGFLTAVSGIAALGGMWWSVRALLKMQNSAARIVVGLEAEQAVGQELDQLMRHGAVVFHDLPADGFNIDHVVIAPSGVCAVETKGRTKPKRGQGLADATVVFDGQRLKFPDWTEAQPIAQAERQAQWLAKWLTQAVGEPVNVRGVVALPGWMVRRQGKGPVWVVSGKEVASLLKVSSDLSPLTPQMIQRIAHQVEQRCRDVKSSYDQTRPAVPVDFAG